MYVALFVTSYTRSAIRGQSEMLYSYNKETAWVTFCIERMIDKLLFIFFVKTLKWHPAAKNLISTICFFFVAEVQWKPSEAKAEVRVLPQIHLKISEMLADRNKKYYSCFLAQRWWYLKWCDACRPKASLLRCGVKNWKTSNEQETVIPMDCWMEDSIMRSLDAWFSQFFRCHF